MPIYADIKLPSGEIRRGVISKDRRRATIRLSGKKQTWLLKTLTTFDPAHNLERTTIAMDGNCLQAEVRGRGPRLKPPAVESPPKQKSKKRRGGGAKINSPWDAKVAKTLGKFSSRKNERKKGKHFDFGWQSDVG